MAKFPPPLSNPSVRHKTNIVTRGHDTTTTQTNSTIEGKSHKITINLHILHCLIPYNMDNSMILCRFFRIFPVDSHQSTCVMVLANCSSEGALIAATNSTPLETASPRRVFWIPAESTSQDGEWIHVTRSQKLVSHDLQIGEVEAIKRPWIESPGTGEFFWRLQGQQMIHLWFGPRWFGFLG